MPALDTTASNVALGQLSALPFENIIGGPLTAAIKAQAMAAQTTVDFIRSIGLQEVNGKLESINVQFSYQDSSGTFRRLTVPILTIIPIPFIVIETVDIDFKARIAASAQQSTEDHSQRESKVAWSNEMHGGGKMGGASNDFSASYSAKKDSKASQESKYSVEYTMDVHVHAAQTGLPQGMAQILNMLQDGITNKAEAAQLLVFGLPSSIALTADGTDEAFTVIALGPEGDPGDYDFALTFAPEGVIEGSAESANPGKVTLSLTSAPTDATDVVITITASPGDSSSGEQEVVATRTVTILPAPATSQ